MGLEPALALLVVLVLGNYLISRSVLYPPLWFCAMWLIDLGLYWLDLTPMDPIHPETVMIVAVGALLFSAGGVLALLAPNNLFRARFALTRFPPRNNIVKPAVTLFAALGVPLLLWNLITYASTGVGNTIFQRARNNGATGAPDPLPLGTYFNFWAVYAATLFLLERRNKAFWLMAGIALVDGILSTGRVPILALICSLTCAQLFLNGKHNFLAAIKATRIPILLFSVLFFGLFFVTKDTSIYDESASQLIVMLFVGYIVGPTVALDFFLLHPNNYAAAPNHTFKFFLNVASFFGLVGDQTPPPEGHIFIPWPTNVYTIYRTYITDWGLYVGVGIMAIIGLLHTMVYRKARTGSRMGIYFFCVIFYEVFMVIFSDEYPSWGAYANMILFAGIYIVLRSLPLRILPRLKDGYGVRTPAS